MGAGVVTVGRRPYAVGLYWENSPSGRIAQTAKEAAQQPGQQADFYAIRGGNKDGRVPQFGLGQSSAGHKAGMPAFAACLANQQPGSWAGAFRFNEGTVVIIVRDDLVVPDGDQFFFNETDARDRLLQEMGFGGLQRVYAPESWAVPGADTLPISLLLNDRRDIRLQAVIVSKKIVGVGIAGVVVLLLLLGGGWYYQEMQAEEERKHAEADALAAMRAKAQKMVPQALQKPQVEYPPPDRKWERRAEPLEVIEACHKALERVMAFKYGWRLAKLNCDGLVVNMTWERQKGMTNPVEFPPPIRVVTNDMGTSATVTMPLPPLTLRGHEDLFDPDVIIRHYLALDWGGHIAPMADDPPPQPPPGYSGPWDPPITPWVKRSFTVNVQDLPGSMPDMFTGIPGVIVDSLIYTPGAGDLGGAWVIGGIIYENRM